MICLIADRIGLAATDERKIRKVPIEPKEGTEERWARLAESFSLPAQTTWSDEVAAGINYCPKEFFAEDRLPDCWDWTDLPVEKSIRDCYSLLSNEFAHGNISTAAGRTKHIKTLVFASKLDAEVGEKKPIEGLRMSPETRRMLMKWWIATTCEVGGQQESRKPRGSTIRESVK